jgi:8-oxo-dGTP pyrophosphatase MutT (NUDIX family)
MNDLVRTVFRSVAERRPVDGREARSRHRILVALGRLPRPFERESDLTHVTGSAVVLGPAGLLLHRHKRLGLWLQPGGHMDPGETPWDAARREAEEETGLGFASWPEGAPPLAHVDVHPGGRGHIHLDLRYLLQVAGDPTPRPAEGESQEVRWFTWSQAIETADPGLAGFLRSSAADPPAAAGPPG